MFFVFPFRFSNKQIRSNSNNKPAEANQKGKMHIIDRIHVNVLSVPNKWHSAYPVNVGKFLSSNNRNNKRRRKRKTPRFRLFLLCAGCSFATSESSANWIPSVFSLRSCYLQNKMFKSEKNVANFLINTAGMCLRLRYDNNRRMIN